MIINFFSTIDEMLAFSEELGQIAYEHRTELSDSLNTLTPLSDLYGAMMNLATMEGRAKTMREVSRIWDEVDHDEDKFVKVVEFFLSEKLLNGPNDDWSGRTNDFIRAEYDGVLVAARDIKRFLKTLAKSK